MLANKEIKISKIKRVKEKRLQTKGFYRGLAIHSNPQSLTPL